jgi:uncharacterized membrane protein
MHLGLLVMGRHDRYTQHTLILWYRYWFGTSPTITAITWNCLVESGWTELSGVHEAKPKHLLWALMFLKSYGTEAVLSAIVDSDEKTFRKWAWFYVEGIASLHNHIVSNCTGTVSFFQS